MTPGPDSAINAPWTNITASAGPFRSQTPWPLHAVGFARVKIPNESLRSTFSLHGKTPIENGHAIHRVLARHGFYFHHADPARRGFMAKASNIPAGHAFIAAEKNLTPAEDANRRVHPWMILALLLMLAAVAGFLVMILSWSYDLVVLLTWRHVILPSLILLMGAGFTVYFLGGNSRFLSTVAIVDIGPAPNTYTQNVIAGELGEKALDRRVDQRVTLSVGRALTVNVPGQFSGFRKVSAFLGEPEAPDMVAMLTSEIQAPSPESNTLPLS